MTRAKREEAPKPKREHKMGLRTGYDTDGESYWLAPTHVHVQETIEDSVQALNMLVASITNYHATEGKRIAKARREWWDSIMEDLGLEQGPGWAFDRHSGRLYRVEPAADEPSQEAAR